MARVEIAYGLVEIAYGLVEIARDCLGWLEIGIPTT